MLISPAPAGLSEIAWNVAAVAVLMAIWWATETVPGATLHYYPLHYFHCLE